MIISPPRFSNRFCAHISIVALAYFVITVFVRHHHEEYWALVVGITFAVYPWVPKLPEQPDEVKPEKYALFG